MEHSLDSKLIENLEIYISVIPEPKSSPMQAPKKSEKKRLLGRWDSGVSDATVAASDAPIPSAQPHRWDSDVSSCSDPPEAASQHSCNGEPICHEELCR